MDFNKEFKYKLELIDECLKSALKDKEDAPKLIFDAMRYSVFAGGKRIRPVMMLSSYEMFSADTECVLPFCVGLEMIHTYSLIHDDLPAMDNSPLRRGKLTNHMVFGEANAVLAGDGLLNFAFETMLESPDLPKNVLKAMKYVAKCAGVTGMIGGQVIDIDSEDKRIDIDTLKTLQIKKTGALIAAAVCGGAILGGACSGDVKKLEEYSYLVGQAFQIKDDILDETSDAAVLGKPTGSDEENHKNTYVSLLGLEESEKLLKEYTDRAKEILKEFGGRAEFLMGMTDYLLTRKN